MHTFSGTIYQAGVSYGRAYQREIAGFFSQEFGAYKTSKRFVKQCVTQTQKSAPNLFRFVEGVKKYSLLSVEEHILLLLHEEELYHRKLAKKKPHCTAIVATNSNNTLLGQTWDWNTSYFPWASINRFELSSFPSIVTLSYPGLPVCAGINASGLSLMWTGSGYYPPLIPIAGVPTYAIAFEVLFSKSVQDAVELMSNMRNAGAFIFFLGDSTGDFAVVEGVPGEIHVAKVKHAYRANVFQLHDSISSSKQKLPSKAKCHSLKRIEVLKRSFSKARKKPSVMSFKKILGQSKICIEKSYSHATLFQLIADCRRRELHVRTWRQKEKPWQILTV